MSSPKNMTQALNPSSRLWICGFECSGGFSATVRPCFWPGLLVLSLVVSLRSCALGRKSLLFGLRRLSGAASTFRRWLRHHLPQDLHCNASACPRTATQDSSMTSPFIEDCYGLHNNTNETFFLLSLLQPILIIFIGDLTQSRGIECV